MANRTKTPEDPRILRHLRWGWWSLLAYLTLGLVLEALHGFKIQSYVGVDSSMRRLMWTLAHAHGVLLAVVNVLYSFTLRARPQLGRDGSRATSLLLMVATLTLPLGFFAGGVRIHGGDPNLAILLVPLGGIALFGAVLLTARGLR